MKTHSLAMNAFTVRQSIAIVIGEWWPRLHPSGGRECRQMRGLLENKNITF